MDVEVCDCVLCVCVCERTKALAKKGGWEEEERRGSLIVPKGVKRLSRLCCWMRERERRERGASE